MSLVSGWFPLGAVAAAVLATLACLPWEQRRRWRVLLWSIGSAVAVTGVVVGAVHALGLLDWPVPWTFDVWVGGVVLTLVVTAVTWRFVRLRRLLAPFAVVLSVVAAAALVNADYSYFPTFRSLFGTPADTSSVRALAADRRRHTALEHGVLLAMVIPGRVSHFHARDAHIWLPPAYVEDPGLSLPVVELLAGSPSTTADWIRGGDVNATADAYARAHRGIAPLLVMADENGSTTADTECVDGRIGAVETYLTVDVPAFMRRTFQATSGPSSLAVAGLSEGGTCAAVLALRHPGEYRAFGDYSGLAAPTAAATVDAPLTVRTLFHGSWSAYEEHDPAYLLRTHRYPHLAGWFQCGTEDPTALAAQLDLVPLARRAGVDVVADEVPHGGHDFTLWAQSFRRSLPFLAAHLVVDRVA